jgi:formylglycine-generating enzyme required for sulfatase activity
MTLGHVLAAKPLHILAGHALATGKTLVAAAAAGLTALAAASFWQVTPAALEMREIAMADGRVVAFAVHEVTQTEWKTCVDDGGCGFLPDEVIALAGKNYPVAGVNALDVAEYVAWINRRTGQSYRLPSSDEWQTAAQELPKPQYKKLFDDPRLAWAADYGAMPRVSNVIRESGGFGAFKNGLADMAGNVWEWTSSCVVKAEAGRCPAYVVEGLHEAKLSALIREPALGGCTAGVPPPHVGFRLVKDVVKPKS